MSLQHLEKDILIAVKLGNMDVLQNKFDELDLLLKSSNTPIEDTDLFLELFIHDMNTHYGTNLTVQEVWNFADKNIYSSDIREENKTEVRNALKIFKPLQQFCITDWFFSIFSTPMCYSENDLKKSNSKDRSKNVEGLPGQLHPGTVVGGLEMIVGGAVLLCFGGTVAGGVLGAGLIGDGIRRIADDGQADFESSLKNRNSIYQTIR